MSHVSFVSGALCVHVTRVAFFGVGSCERAALSDVCVSSGGGPVVSAQCTAAYQQQRSNSSDRVHRRGRWCGAERDVGTSRCNGDGQWRSVGRSCRRCCCRCRRRCQSSTACVSCGAAKRGTGCCGGCNAVPCCRVVVGAARCSVFVCWCGATGHGGTDNSRAGCRCHRCESVRDNVWAVCLCWCGRLQNVFARTVFVVVCCVSDMPGLVCVY